MDLLRQVKQVARRLSRAPGFTAISLITLAVGIGANTAIFSVVNGVLLKPLPYPDPDRLIGVWQTAPGLGMENINASPATYFTYREENRTLEDIGMWRGDGATVTGSGAPERISVLSFTDGMLPILRVQPLIGRRFSRADDTPGSPETAMLSFGYWQRRFGGSPGVVGKRIVVDGVARDIIGVLPSDFQFMNGKADILLPMRYKRSDFFIGNFSYQTLARLKPGATMAQASADVARMIPLMPSKFPPAPGMSMKMLEEARLGPSLRPFKQDVVGDIGKILWVLMGTVGIVLLIACANVANLLLVRAEARQFELAIRAALGAGWGSIARELLLESGVLGILGGVLGLALARAALSLLVFLAPANLPRLEEITVDPVVMLFTLAISLFAGLVFGLAPVFKYGGPRMIGGLRDGGRTGSVGRERHRARNTMVVVQVALALVLLISSGLMIRTLRAMRQVQPGFTEPEQILTLGIAIPDALIRDADRVLQVHEEIMRKIEAVPGVSSVALANSITMDGYNNNDPIFAEDHKYSENQIPPIRRFKHISPGLFKTMGNRLIAGRDFTWTDLHDKRNVVLLSENLARELWRDPARAVGKRVRENPKAPWREVVGVVGEERDDGVHQKAPAIVYWPLIVRDFWGQATRVQRTAAYAIRSPRAGSAGLLREVRAAVWSVNPDLPIADVRTVQEIYDKSMARTSFTLVMLSLASGMALLLGVVGIYGVISYSVSQRTREIGIRMALGAEQTTVRRMFLRHGLLLTAAGVACGLVAAFSVTRLMVALLFEVSPLDPVTYGAVSLVLLAAAMLATYLPARRATVIAPVDALRTE